MKRVIKYTLVLVVTLFIMCAKNTEPDDPVLVRIGDDVIRVSDFRSNYEFGYSNLKRGKDSKRTYLDYMIKERVLAQQGYKMGMDKSKTVQNAVQKLEKELLIEELYVDQVHSKITVNYEEMKEAVEKTKVKWKFRYWMEPTFERAQKVALAMRESGYTKVLEDLLNRNVEMALSPQEFESDYVTWLDVPEELLNAIKDLPRG